MRRATVAFIACLLLALPCASLAADGAALLAQAQKLRDEGKRPAASVKQRDAVAAFKAAGDWAIWSEAQLDLSYDLHLLGRNAQAIAEADEVIAEADRRGDRRIQAWALASRGGYQGAMNDFAGAGISFGKGLDLARLDKDRDREALILRSRGDLLRRQGSYDEGRADLDQSLALFEAEGMEHRAAEVRVQIGTLEYDAKRSHLTEPFLREALKQSEAPLVQGHSHLYLGKIHLERGQFAEARTNFAEALARYRSLNAHLDEANVLFDMGTLEYLEKNYAEAARNFGDAEISYGKASQSDGAAAARQARQDAEKALRDNPPPSATRPEPPPKPPVVEPPAPSPPSPPNPSWIDKLIQFLIDKSPEIIGTIILGLLAWMFERRRRSRATAEESD